MSDVPLPDPVYHQWRKKKMPWSLEFAFNSMCHATTDDSEVRTLHTADQMRAYAAAVSAAENARLRERIAEALRLLGTEPKAARAVLLDAINGASHE